MEIMPDERADLRPGTLTSHLGYGPGEGVRPPGSGPPPPRRCAPAPTGRMSGAPHPVRLLPVACRVWASCCTLPRQYRRRGTATRDNASVHEELTADGTLFRMRV